MNIPSNHVDGRMLVLTDGRRIGPFSSHWAGCAAMIRCSDPTFKSTGGDLQDDLNLEKMIVPPYERALAAVLVLLADESLPPAEKAARIIQAVQGTPP